MLNVWGMVKKVDEMFGGMEKREKSHVTCDAWLLMAGCIDGMLKASGGSVKCLCKGEKS